MKKLKVVTIGGGTGTFVVLKGIKKIENLDICAIVSTADDGGSNKKFRDEFGLLPPSDFRQCLVALSDEERASSVLRKLFLYRFDKGTGLEGQTFGNIFIAALSDIEGSQLKALDITGKLFKVEGKILPITTDDIRLVAKYENRKTVVGEHKIDEPKVVNPGKIVELKTDKKAVVYKKAKKAILEADFIIIGPGDLFTSTLANIVVGKTSDFICSSKAKIIYIVNLMTKFGQTDRFKASDHIQQLQRYLGKYPDFVIVNQDKIIKEMQEKYKLEKGEPVIDDLKCHDKRFKVIKGSLTSVVLHKKADSDKLNRSVLRHDPGKLRKFIERIINVYSNSLR